MRKRITMAFLCATLAGCGGDNTVSQDGGPDPGGPYLPLGAVLECGEQQKVSGVDRVTGNLVCSEDPDLDTNTMYTAGDGLALNETTFSVAFSEFSCPGSDKVTGFSAGTPVCQADQRSTATQVPRNNSIVLVDADSSTGRYTSMTIGADGLPVISYRDSGASADLRVAKCTDVACTSLATITTVDGADDVGEDTSITIGGDGFPVVSYYDVTNTALKVAKCADHACAAASIQVVDSGGTEDVGQHTSIAVGVDGLPVVAYYDFSNGNLKVAHCANATCMAGTSTITIVDGLGAADVGEYNSIAIGTDGRPVISYFNNTDNNLWVAKCGDAACSSGNALNLVDDGPAGTVGRYNSITVGADGLPVVSYLDSNSGGLLVVRCANAACGAVAGPPTIVDGTGTPDVQDTSITIGADGLPIIAYYDGVAVSLRVAKCGDVGCTAGNTVVTVDTDFVGEYPSITIGTDGRPIIAYRGDSRLKVAQCANPFCLPFWTRR